MITTEGFLCVVQRRLEMPKGLLCPALLEHRETEVATGIDRMHVPPPQTLFQLRHETPVDLLCFGELRPSTEQGRQVVLQPGDGGMLGTEQLGSESDGSTQERQRESRVTAQDVRNREVVQRRRQVQIGRDTGRRLHGNGFLEQLLCGHQLSP